MLNGRTLKLPYRGAPMSVMVIRDAALRSQQQPIVRMLAEETCRYLPSKDCVSEALAFYYLVLDKTRYMRDPRTIELVRAPWRVIPAIMAGQQPGLDCLPMGTLLLDSRYRLLPIEQLEAGQKIWGLDRWSEVQAVAFKGELPVDAIFLNNGSVIRATPDHKVYVGVCRHFAPGSKRALECSCPMAERDVVRIPVSEVTARMAMLTPDRIPFGEQEADPRRALIEGLYLSDGWHQGSAFYISGQDGCPKEAQKAEVQRVCEELGIPTTWHRKSIAVRDAEWVIRMQEMGARAVAKQALSIGLEESAALELLRGIMADSGANTHGTGRTLTTTSRALFLQARLLHKMQGIACSERFIADHGGLGANPIWRLGIRQAERADGRQAKMLRVKAVERAVGRAPVYDLQTDDHYVYLPEADVTVSNCDDMTALICALCLASGAETRAVTVAFQNAFYRGQRQYSHVFAQAKEPRTGQWITLDPVAGDRTKEMLSRVVAYKLWPIA